MTSSMTAPKTRWGSALFQFDARRRLQRAFATCLARGVAPLRSRLLEGPVIVALNHVAFWDGFLLARLEHALGADAYCLMDRENLQKFPFLRFAGAVPLDCHDARRGRSDLERAARLLDRPGRVLFVFPQGRQTPTQAPLRFRSGVLRLARLASVPVVPTGLSYEFLQDQKPEIRISIGPPMSVGAKGLEDLRRLEAAVRDQLDVIDASLVSEVGDGGAFTPLFSRRPAGMPAGSRWLALAAARRAR